MTSALPSHASDEDWMRAAIALGKQAQGRTAENPPVGCIILDKSGHVVGQGYTAIGGRPHAETQALAMAGALAKKGTAYVSLEPCAHSGKTPPCVDALIAAGISRCIIGVLDPDKRVDGAGIAKLKQAGIEVRENILLEHAQDVLAGFLTRINQNRPFISMKIAVSADGYIAAGQGQRTQITGKMAQRFAHDMRSRHDAILTGSGTAITDNPILTCRAPLAEADSPTRIILDSQLRLPLDSQLVQSAGKIPLILVVSSKVHADHKKPYLDKGAEFIVVDEPDKQLYLSRLFEILAGKGINTVMVEAGARLNTTVISQGLADNIFVLQAPVMLGEGAVSAVVGEDGLESQLKTHYKKRSLQNLDSDVLVRWQVK